MYVDVCLETDVDNSLTVKTMDDLVDALEAQPQWEPRCLVLPGWFPEDQRSFAEQWAGDHGWDGVLYAGEE
jgi:hypothetical protein